MQLLLWDIFKPVVDGLLGRGKSGPPLFPGVVGERGRKRAKRARGEGATALDGARGGVKAGAKVVAKVVPPAEPVVDVEVQRVQPEPKPRRRGRGEVAAAIAADVASDANATKPAQAVAASSKAAPAKPAASLSAQERYDAVVKAMLDQYGIKVRKWRKNMSGVAYELRYRDGSVKRLLESPYPKGPMSAAIFLHEIGHHAIGFNRYKPRCLEEYHAWKWSLEAMEAQGLDVTDAVRYRMHLSLWYAVGKASRRGIKNLPPELLAFTEKPVKVGAGARER